jgi:hypothetical protein
MRSFWLLPLLLVLTQLRPATGLAEGLDVKSDLAANAAVQYWQAFAQLPTLDKEQEKLLAEWNTVPLDAAAQKLIDSSRSSMVYLRRGSVLPRCDWCLEYNDGMGLLLPHLAKARDLARFAALHARQELEQGNKKAAQADATAIMVLARHVRRDPIMVSLLVGYSLEGVATDLMAPYVPELKASYTKALASYESLPAAANLQQSIAIEHKYMCEWAIKKLREEEQREKGAGLKLWRTFMDGPEIPDALKQLQSLDEVLKMADGLLPVYDQIAKLLSLPNDQFDAQYPAFREKTKAANPVAGVMLPAIDKVRAKEQQSQARVAMLLAAIAVAESGPEKLKELKDPFGTGPFEYRALDKGFELKSKLQYEGQPVTLMVGQRKKN